MIGAFFDTEGRFVSELLDRSPEAKVFIGFDPVTVWLSDLPDDTRLALVDARSLGEGRDGYLHAKAVYMEGEGDDALLAVGSANPSAPAWLTRGGTVNTEVMLIHIGQAAHRFATEIQMDVLKYLPRVSNKLLHEATTRSSTELSESSQPPASVLMGIADHRDQTITIENSDLPSFNRIDVLTDQGQHLNAVIERTQRARSMYPKNCLWSEPWFFFATMQRLHGYWYITPGIDRSTNQSHSSDRNKRASANA